MGTGAFIHYGSSFSHRWGHAFTKNKTLNITLPLNFRGVYGH